MFGAIDQDLLRREDGHRSARTSSSSPSCPAPPRSSRSAVTTRTPPACPDVDIAITTRELARMIRTRGINFTALPDEDFDQPLGESTGAGVIFGATGGVMEAALRTAVESLTGKTLEQRRLRRGPRHRRASRRPPIDVGGMDVKVAVAQRPGERRPSCSTRSRSGEADYHFIEVMGCPGGCVNGGGQPIVSRPSVRNFTDLRAAARQGPLRRGRGQTHSASRHENPDDQEDLRRVSWASPAATRRTSCCTPPTPPRSKY